MKNFPRDTPQTTQFEAFRDFDMTAQLPCFRFPASVEVQPFPPFGGALLRFFVYLRDSETRVSVYLDASCALGSMPEPYWEIYPNAEGDTTRFLLSESEELVAAVLVSLEARA